MGLDTSHNCFNGSYSGFTEFRNKLALYAGYKLKSEIGEYGNIHTYIDLNWEQFEDENLEGIWKTEQKDPLIYLFIHSDCDGYIAPKEAKVLAPRLKELVPLLNEKDFYFIEVVNKFIKGLNLAASKNQKVKFH